MTSRTLFDKVWAAHVVHQFPEGPALLYVDLHLVHEVTSPQAVSGLRTAGRRVRRPDLALAAVDHNVPTDPARTTIRDPDAAAQVEALQGHRRAYGATLFNMNAPEQG